MIFIFRFSFYKNERTAGIHKVNVRDFFSLENIDGRLSSVEQRLTSVEQGLSYLYERQSMPSLTKLLNDFYLIDIRRLDTRILSSLDPVDMDLFFHFVASHMTAKIYFATDMIDDFSRSTDKYSISMKKINHKLCQLERQIYYLAFYYSVSLAQFFAGPVLVELYRNPSINPDKILNKLMSSNQIQSYVPLLFRLLKMERFILTY